MTFEETIQSMYDHYPRVANDRIGALDQLFCTVGNGMAWENGELVDPGLPAPVHELKNGKAHQYLPTEERNEPRVYRWYLFVVQSLQYTALSRIPSDIKPDWKVGVEEVLAMLREDGFEVDGTHPAFAHLNMNERLMEKNRIYQENEKTPAITDEKRTTFAGTINELLQELEKET